MRGQESRRAFGRRSEADSPLAYLILQAQEAIVRGETNLVAQEFANLAETAPDENFWTVNKVTSRRKIDEETGLVEDYVVNQLLAEDKDTTVVAKFDGKERRVTLNKNNPAAMRLADAMRRLTDSQTDGAVKYLGAINRWLSAVNTRYHVEFVVTNMLRDVETAAINAQGLDVENIGKNTAKYYFPALKAAYAGARGKMQGEWGKWYDDFTADGGKTGFNYIPDIQELKSKIEGEFNLAQSRAGNDGRVWLKAVRAKNAAVDLIENLNDGVENAVRLSVYRAAIEGGASRKQAASMAKNITVNFNRRGQLGPVMNSLYMFYNAGVQGSVRTLQGVYYSPKIRKIVAGVALAGAAQEMLNMMISGDDDDGESFYDKIPAFEKERNIIVMYGQGPNDFIKIPLAYGHNVFWEMGRTTAEIARRGGDRWQESAGNFVGTVAGSFNPIGFSTEGRSGFESLVSFILPTLADIPNDLAQNVNFMGSPIMPEENQYGPQDPDAQRYFPGVSPIWRGLTDLLTEASGGNKVEAGAIDISPETLEHLADTVFGAAGSLVNRTAALPFKIASGEATANDFPIVRKVIGAKNPYYDRGVFYDRLSEIEARLKTGNELAEAEMVPQLERFIEDNRRVLTLEPEFKEAKKLSKQIRKEKRASEAMLEKGKIDQAQHDANVETLSTIEQELVLNFNRRWVDVVYKGDADAPIE